MHNIHIIMSSFIEAAHILKTLGLEKHAQDLDESVDALINTERLYTSRASTSDTGRTVTAERISPQERANLRRIRMKYKNRKPARKKAICCTKMERRKTRKGYVWGAVCHFIYKSGSRSGSIGATWTVVSKGIKKPLAVIKDNRKMPICRAGQIERLKSRLKK